MSFIKLIFFLNFIKKSLKYLFSDACLFHEKSLIQSKTPMILPLLQHFITKVKHFLIFIF